MPTTSEVKAVPYWSMALRRAVSSFSMACGPPETQRPSRRDVRVLMAAGMAWTTSLAVCH